MTEAFLYHVWKHGLFNQEHLCTSAGEPVHILKPGMSNPDEGPDFFNALIRLDGTLWAGNVEIHVRSSDWKRHGHSNNRSYENIILHVVYEEDEPVRDRDRRLIPCLSLRDRIAPALFSRYSALLASREEIPCAASLPQTDALVLHAWMDRVLVERLEWKAAQIRNALLLSKYNWEEVFYHTLARNFGFRTNSVPFELVAKSLPLSCIAKHKDNLMQVEALLFGQSGLLHPGQKGEYPRALWKEHRFLAAKFSLEPVDPGLWKLMRMRPRNFPAVRIAQFAALLHRNVQLFAAMLECSSVEEVRSLLCAEASDYWSTHYMFDKPSPESVKQLGVSSADNIVVNTLVPFLFVYGREKGLPAFSDRALDFLEALAPEKNRIIAAWSQSGVKASNALQGQALLQLSSHYCSSRRCLDCGIGSHLLRGGE
jgi:hypothetical protein